MVLINLIPLIERKRTFTSTNLRSLKMTDNSLNQSEPVSLAQRKIRRFNQW